MNYLLLKHLHMSLAAVSGSLFPAARPVDDG
ncbi:SirB2 family protein [Massilia sp. B-10]|nr:SirB2 family protein [Massilia sp. B-10]